MQIIINWSVVTDICYYGKYQDKPDIDKEVQSARAEVYKLPDGAFLEERYPGRSMEGGICPTIQRS